MEEKWPDGCIPTRSDCILKLNLLFCNVLVDVPVLYETAMVTRKAAQSNRFIQYLQWVVVKPKIQPEMQNFWFFGECECREQVCPVVSSTDSRPQFLLFVLFNAIKL